jgi:hypothetical protein
VSCHARDSIQATSVTRKVPVRVARLSNFDHEKDIMSSPPPMSFPSSEPDGDVEMDSVVNTPVPRPHNRPLFVTPTPSRHGSQPFGSSVARRALGMSYSTPMQGIPGSGACPLGEDLLRSTRSSISFCRWIPPRVPRLFPPPPTRDSASEPGGWLSA